ncbi:MAG TPA: hypothetical protein DCQ98_00245 [Planctomycetaceae bacterium]|nr:hypothetical protein [Planctomycetaceae bacterium]
MLGNREGIVRSSEVSVTSRTSVAVIIGGGPAGLTAASELLERTSIRPIVLEASDMLGGISRTVNYRGNRIDIGGHRFFSKSDRVMAWWRRLLPIEKSADDSFEIRYQGKSTGVDASCDGPDPATTDRVMLIRPRKSRIYFLRRFFDYPLRLSTRTLANLGPIRIARIAVSYAAARLKPIRPEKNLEQFLINRFGTELYRTFFRAYTEKVWGVPCDRIDAAWGAQRIKGLSITAALRDALSRPFRRRDVGQKQVETSLIERFLYPKLGPGQMWEACGDRIRALGGEILMRHRVVRFERSGDRMVAVFAVDEATGDEHRFECDHVLSSMPVVDLVRGLDDFESPVPREILAIAEGLAYRDFITVGLLVRRLKPIDRVRGKPVALTDNWLYIQEPDVKVGRLQIFDNWSPYLVADRTTTWLGLEYFCSEGDALWSSTDERLRQLGAEELQRIGLLEPGQVLDGTVLRVPKAYPAYFGAYDRFDELRRWLDRIDNLYPIGRNGMHRYNNQDHSMLAAMTVVDGLIAGGVDREALWSVNADAEYHETRAASSDPAVASDAVAEVPS